MDTYFQANKIIIERPPVLREDFAEALPQSTPHVEATLNALLELRHLARGPLRVHGGILLSARLHLHLLHLLCGVRRQ